MMFARLGKLLWALRLALPKVGVGWMFALLTIDFNRVAIFELGIAAVVVTSLLSVHYFLSPFQVIAGRLADTHPLFGYRRTPYMIGASVGASLLFLALPKVAIGMGAGSAGSFAAGVLLFVAFGIFLAFIADSYHSLVAEVTTKENRGGVIALAWIVMILSTIVAAVVMNRIRPEYSPELMQRLYNLTPFVVVICTLVGVVGIEKRLNPQELETARLRARALAPPGNPLGSAFQLLRENPSTRAFFAFIVVSIFSIFLQENVIEVFGAEVFGMGIRETTRFQPIWGGGVLLGMAITGLLGPLVKVSRKETVLIGLAGTAVGFVALALVAAMGQRALLHPTLFGMGIFTGIFNVGALALMMEMTVEGATGMYMGLWGMAQASGQALASIGSGALHTVFIGSGLLAPQVVYSGIFLLEAVGLMAAGYLLYPVNLTQFATSAGRTFRDAFESSGVPAPVAAVARSAAAPGVVVGARRSATER
jgi:MFS transporter, BCD family, chlorophyll transporter